MHHDCIKTKHEPKYRNDISGKPSRLRFAANHSFSFNSRLKFSQKPPARTWAAQINKAFLPRVLAQAAAYKQRCFDTSPRTETRQVCIQLYRSEVTC